MVEGGENDSFDTSILHDDEEFIISSGSDPSSQPIGSQSFSIGGSQPFSIGGSQDDNIENFLSKAENDEQVLLRSPFRPSIPKSVRESSKEDMRHRTSEPEFYMPKVEVESPRKSSTRSSTATVKAAAQSPQSGVRRRQGRVKGSPTKVRRLREDGSGFADEPTSVNDRIVASLPGALLDAFSWLVGIVGLGLRYAQKPLAILFSLYVTFGCVIILQNMVTQSFYASLSPLCRIPGASWLDLPFCPDIVPTTPPTTTTETGKEAKNPVEFDSLMRVQGKFEQVLEKSAQGVSLPLEMKRSEASIRDLRTLVRYSSLQGKDELVLEFDGFIEIAGTASSDLQRFNTHVGSAVDSVISINRWTSRYLDGLESNNNENNQPGGLIGAWTSWLFTPFQPAVFSEQELLYKYIEHTELVSDKIKGLVDEAQEVLRTLGKAEDHLGIICDFVTRTQRSVQSRKDEILRTLWTLVGGNQRRLGNLNNQLLVLEKVDGHRSAAVEQVTELVLELGKIQAGLEDLRERVAAPGLVSWHAKVPLSVHIETINRGVERLEAARSRVRAVENERIREVLARGKVEGRMIESK